MSKGAVLLDNFSILCKRKNIEFPKQSCTFILGSLSLSSREINTLLLCSKCLNVAMRLWPGKDRCCGTNQINVHTNNLTPTF